MAFDLSAPSNMAYDFLGSGQAMSSWGQGLTPGGNIPGGWNNDARAYAASGGTKFKMPQILPGSTNSNFGAGLAGASQARGTPVEFYLGAAPSQQGVDLSGVVGGFRDVFNQLNSGVNPNFFVDNQKLATEAKAVAQQLNLSPGEIKNMIAGINPSIGEVTSQAASAAAQLNDPTKIGQQAGKMASILNQKYIDQFDAAMPGYKQNMRKANEITSNYLAGKIPQDVVDQIFRNSAAKGFATGLYGGGIGRNIVARDLGLTSLQLQSAGAGLLDQTAKLAATVSRETMPVSGAEFAGQLITNPASVFNTIANYNHVDPSAIFNAVYVKPSDIYNNMANMAQQSTMARANFEASKLVAPSQVFSALTDQAQYNSQIANSNALNAWQSQALPGQFDIQKGQFVSFNPGQYVSQRPSLPGSGSANLPLATKEEYAKNPLYWDTVNQQRMASNAANANWSGSAYRPQLRA